MTSPSRNCPRARDPADLAQRDPEALREVRSQNAVPFLRFRLDRVLESANLATAEGRARAAERAMDVLAEHPSELVRDQYIMSSRVGWASTGDCCAPRVAELAKQPRERAVREIAERAATPSARARSPMPRPGLEALRLRVHGPDDVKERLIAPYFVNDVQREIFEAALTRIAPLSELIDELERRGEEEAAHVLSELAVEELDRDYTVEDVTAVVSQLIRSAVHVELKNVDARPQRGQHDARRGRR